MLKKRELLRKTNLNFIKIDLNFPATLASPSFELATLGIESKTVNPTATEAYTIMRIYTAKIPNLFAKIAKFANKSHFFSEKCQHFQKRPSLQPPRPPWPGLSHRV
jgi:hypothetical protein